MSKRGSGETARYALEYINYSMPRFVMLENVRGILSGEVTRDMLTFEIIRDVLSNIFILVRSLKSKGYLVPRGLLDNAPRHVVKRLRAYVPAVHMPEELQLLSDKSDKGIDDLTLLCESLMSLLAESPSKCVVTVADIKIDEGHPQFFEWLEKANSSASREIRVAYDKLFKWKCLHERVYYGVGSFGRS